MKRKDFIMTAILVINKLQFQVKYYGICFTRNFNEDNSHSKHFAAFQEKSKLCLTLINNEAIEFYVEFDNEFLMFPE